jgi:hypothetical protein
MASLVPLLRELIQTLRHTLDEHAIRAPLMVVKGDGSLVRAEWAMLRPIETVLSGPAASSVGAWHLARQAGEDLGDGALECAIFTRWKKRYTTHASGWCPGWRRLPGTWAPLRSRCRWTATTPRSRTEPAGGTSSTWAPN